MKPKYCASIYSKSFVAFLFTILVACQGETDLSNNLGSFEAQTSSLTSRGDLIHPSFNTPENFSEETSPNISSEPFPHARSQTYVCDVSTLIDNFSGCFADLDQNGFVDGADRGQVTANFGREDADSLCVFDLDGNGEINGADRGEITASFGRCSALPNFQNGSGLNAAGTGPDTRFSITEVNPEDCDIHFSDAINYHSGHGTTNDIFVADLNNDSMLDIVMGHNGQNATRGGMSLFINDGNGYFPFPNQLLLEPSRPSVFVPTEDHQASMYEFIPPMRKASQVVAMDIDQNGTIDLVSIESNYGALSVNMNDGLGNFSAPIQNTLQYENGIGIAQLKQIKLADLNGNIDPYPDLIAVKSGGIYILRNQGAADPGQFEQIASMGGAINHRFPNDAAFEKAIAIADFNGDGLDDIALPLMQGPANREKRLFLKIQDPQEQRGFRHQEISFNLNQISFKSVQAADIDQDGDADLMVHGIIVDAQDLSKNIQKVFIFKNNGQGQFDNPLFDENLQFLESSNISIFDIDEGNHVLFNVASLSFADVNQDGYPDIIAPITWFESETDGWKREVSRIYWNNGQGYSADQYQDVSLESPALLGDVNHQTSLTTDQIANICELHDLDANGTGDLVCMHYVGDNINISTGYQTRLSIVFADRVCQ